MMKILVGLIDTKRQKEYNLKEHAQKCSRIDNQGAVEI